MAHRLVVGDDGEDDVRQRGHAGERGAGFRAQFARQFQRGGGAHVEDRGDGETDFPEAAGHVRAHAADADESDSLCHSVGLSGGWVDYENSG
jgi:hypothetical protein